MNARPFLFAAVCGLSGVGAVVACSSVQNSQIGIDAPLYTEDSFKLVGDFLDHRCGSLDCHGQAGRNFRVWGCEGMRLPSDGGAVPICALGGSLTTPAEHYATYRSLVGLEPQVMTAVFTGSATAPGCSKSLAADGGDLYPPTTTCHPEFLTFIRKARGTEAHKGGQLICVTPPCPPGVQPPDPFDPQDVCLVSWLEGATDGTACGAAIVDPNFPTPGDASTQ